jgi:hypothetical protein
MSKRTGLVFAFICVLSTTLAADSHAFFQKTTLEGTLGNDVSGVWLAVQHLMPSFRVRVDRDPANGAPFKIGPIPKELAPALGENPKGVAIKEFTDKTASDKYGIFQGDVITKVNTMNIANEDDFAKAMKEAKEWFLITIRRPALKFSTARLIKIDYKAAEKEVEGTSQLEEKIDVRIGDGTLPFQEQIEKGRRDNNFFVASDKVVSGLQDDWYKLAVPEKGVFVNGEHRVVAAANYDEALRQDDNLKGTSFAIISTLQGNPLAGGAGQSIAIYGFDKIGPERMGGNYVESTLATAPFPISIEFTGRFEMIKIAPFSNKDLEFRTAQAQAEGKKKQEEEGKKFELAPDVPANIPKPADEPAVAE